MDMSFWNPPLDKEATLLFTDHFNEFCQRPYFGRVWIIQELFGGRNGTLILCGTYQLDWDALVDLRMRLEKNFNFWSEPPYTGWADERISRLQSPINIHGDSAFPLRHLLDEISTFDCHDDRDRIFGTLNLIGWTRYGKIAPLPDYNISPVQLAFDVMRLNDEMDLDVARRTILALNLHDSRSSLGQWLRDKSQDDLQAKVPSDHNLRRYSTTIHGANLINQDGKGRLYVAFRASRNSESTSFSIPEALHLPSNDLSNLETSLAANGLVPISTCEGISALACGETRPGHILLKGSHSDLVLRARADGLSFSAVGQALVVNGYNAYQGCDFSQCACWAEDSQANYKEEFVKLAIDLSDSDALTAIGSREMIEDANGHTSIDVLTYLKRYSLGRLTRDAVVHDINMQDFETNRNIGPSKALCERHQSAERYRMSRQVLLYDLAPGDGAYVQVSK